MMSPLPPDPPLSLTERQAAWAFRLSFASFGLTAIYMLLFQFTTSWGIINIQNKANLTSSSANLSLHLQSYAATLNLISCGVLVGISMIFLGFGLFLLSVKEVIQGRVQMDSLKVQLTSISPGAFVILLGALLTAWCIAQRPESKFTFEGQDLAIGSAANSPTNDVTGDPAPPNTKE